MRDIWLIAKREYLEQVRGKAFRVTTILIPGAFAGVLAVMLLTGKLPGMGKHIAIAANPPALAGMVRDQLQADKDTAMTVDVVPSAGPAEKADLIAKVDNRDLDGFLWIELPADGPAKVTYDSRSSGDFVTEGRLTAAVNHALVEERLAGRGIPASQVESLTKRVELETMRVEDGKELPSDAMQTFWAAYAMAFLLMFTVILYGMNVGRSVIQEKTSRIFEVMLSTVKPGDLLAGKLIGTGAVGFTQLAIWGVAAALFFGTAFAQRLLAGEFRLELSAAEVVLFVIYFVLGYALYSTLFAGLAATCDTEQELQQYAPLAAVPAWLGFGTIVVIVSNPNSVWSVALSMFPLCAPITMVFRLASQFPPYWQIAASVGLMAVSVYAVMWFSSRVYRIGILMYGKRATLPEMLRWLRYS